METVVLDDLIARAQQREPAAFDELVEAYSKRLYGYFYRLVGSRQDAEDLLQEVFVRLVRTISQYEHDGRFEAWLFRIAANLVRDRVRRSQRSRGLDRGTGMAEAAIDPFDQVPDRIDERPDHGLDRAEQVDRLQQAVDQLPGPEREVVLLRHFSGMSFKEVAEVMGTPLGTALARAHRGLARLRDLLAES